MVQCQTERSQFQNKESAMKILRARLLERQIADQQEKLAELKGEQNEIAWGNQIRSYVFCPYTMVKDHRTGVEVGNVDGVMDGELDEFIEEYLKQKSRLISSPCLLVGRIFKKGADSVRVKSKHLIAVLIIIIISVIGIPKFVFPHLVSENLQAALEKKFGGDIFVEVNTKFGWELIAGIFSSIRIVGKDLIFDALTIAEIDLECSNLRINLKKLIQDQEFEYYSCERLLTKLILAESHLNQYYWAKIDPNKYFKINISKEELP